MSPGTGVAGMGEVKPSSVTMFERNPAGPRHIWGCRRCVYGVSCSGAKLLSADAQPLALPEALRASKTAKGWIVLKAR